MVILHHKVQLGALSGLGLERRRVFPYFYLSFFSILFAPLQVGHVLVPFPRQAGQGRCMAVLLRCRPCPLHSGQETNPLPLQSGHAMSVCSVVILVSF